MFTVIYNWKVNPKLELEFLRVWHARTVKIHKFLGSYGSRLYKAENGTYIAIALWPSREQWASLHTPLPDDAEDAEIFAKAVEEDLSTQTLTMVDDLWDYPRPESPRDALGVHSHTIS
ncbi:MAG: hypothetical protein M3Z14_07350 [Candidatus Eremiobacteraeota bacterium]|nr:hypothetical protein [Candidatus Eremiobacteraeota bacterium]